MRPTARRRAVLGIAALAFSAGVSALSAQTPAARLRAGRRDTIPVDSGAAVTAVFAVANSGRDSLRARASLVIPRGWSTLTGTSEIALAPNASDTWLVSVAAPANAPAGVYVVRARIEAAGVNAADSVFIRVAERRALELMPVDVPGWVPSDGGYDARFIVRNRGNVASTVSLSGTSTRGTRCVVDMPTATLAPGVSATVTLHVAAAPHATRATDDLIELTAVDVRDHNVRATSAARTTVVPRGATAEDGPTLPAQLSLRAASARAGVSPVTFSGAGFVGGTKTSVDFSYHARTTQQSVFGEREEYHVAVRGQGFDARAGDGMYGFSPIASGNMMGLGGMVEGARGSVAGGAYAARSRWGTNQPIEMGAFFGTPLDARTRLDANVVERRAVTGELTSIGSVASQFVVPAGTLAIEVAGSRDSAGAPGMGERARLTGGAGALSYSVGHTRGTPSFGGSQHGQEQDDAMLSFQPLRRLTLMASGMATVSTPVLAAARGQRFSNASVGASLGGYVTADYVRTTREDLGRLTGSTGESQQQGLRATASVPLGRLQLSTTVEGGPVADVSGRTRNYLTVDGSVRLALGDAQGITLFANHADGNALGNDGRDIMNGGVSAQLRLPVGFNLNVLATGASLPAPATSMSRVQYGQLDARLERRLPTGAVVALQAHLWANAALQGSPVNNLMFLEVRSPLRLPAGRRVLSPRVEGRVVDAGTGRPVAGTLVRVGDQAAVTDKNGHVSLSGFEPGEYHVAVDASGAASRALVGGDQSVRVVAGATRPATFTVLLAEGGRVRAVVRRLAQVASLEAASDSLVDEGLQSNVLVALENGRDTLYQTSDERGHLDFGKVPVGRWTLTIRSPGDVTERSMPESVLVTVTPGENQAVELHLVPARRTITVSSGGALRAKNEPRKN